MQFKALIVDDNAAFRMLISRLLNSILIDESVTPQIDVVSEGSEVLPYLDRNQKSLPAVIFCDVQMPQVNGFQVLERLKGHPHYRRIPVVMLSASTEPEDISGAFDRHCIAYFSKDVPLNEFVGKLVKAKDLLEASELP